MTDDITRGLTLLADEAEPASVDADEVITRARARTRNRRAIAATAVATVAVISVLVATLGNADPPNDPVARSTERVVDRLNRQLARALPDLIPSGWSLVANPPFPHFTFDCLTEREVVQAFRGTTCEARADYHDGVGALDVEISVDKVEKDLKLECEEPHCTPWGSPIERDLRDGTTTETLSYTQKPASRDGQELRAKRPDGTQVSIAVYWPQGQRSTTPLTTDQILKFATVFDFGDAQAPTASPSPTPKIDPQKEARLNSELDDVLGAVIPAGWSRVPDQDPGDGPPFTFDCREETPGSGVECWTAGYYRDATGTVGLKFDVSPEQNFGGTCEEDDCTEKVLPDGTRTELKKEFHAPIHQYSHSVSAFRPDGTVIWVEVFWTEQRSQTPLTDEQLLEFATAFTY